MKHENQIIQLRRGAETIAKSNNQTSKSVPELFRAPVSARFSSFSFLTEEVSFPLIAGNFRLFLKEMFGFYSN